MKRDWDLIRSILLHMEEHDSIRGLELDSEEGMRVIRHLELMQESDLIQGVEILRTPGLSSPGIRIVGGERLTSEGYDFLEAARNQGRWKKAKERIAAAGGGVTLGALKGVLTHLLKEALL